MANVPSWFSADAYFKNKLAVVQAGNGWESLQLEAAFKSAGYDPNNAESMYSHFVKYGNAEGISPNYLFNADEYLYNKAADFYFQVQGVENPPVTPAMIQSMLMAMNQSGMSPWDHYWAFGAKEGVNPSTLFDTNDYVAAKVAKMNADKYGERSDWTFDEVMSALVKDDLTPLTHYYMFGVDEDLDFEPAPINSAPGSTYFLTEGRDHLYGTTGDDQFHADVAGDLNDGDYIDGGLGYDTVFATVGGYSGQAGAGNNSASQPRMANVEKVVLQAQAITGDGGSNIVAGDVHIDAGRIQGKIHNNLNPEFEFMGKDQGLQYLKNDDSRANLTVENVRSYTTDMTIGWANADAGAGVDFTVYFDSQYLKSGSVQQSGSLRFEVMDVETSQALQTHSLEKSDVYGIRFKFVSSTGQTEEVTLEAATGWNGTGATVETFLASLQEALAASKWAGTFTLSLAKDTYLGTAGSGVDQWRYPGGHQIILETNDGVSGTMPLSDARYLRSNDVETPGFGLSAKIRADESETCPLITTSVDLDNVGRVQWTDDFENCLPDEAIFGSEAGDLIIGAQDARAGIERFDLKVDRGSWLTSLASTNNTLRAVNVKAGDVNGDGKAGNLEWQANDTNVGELFIGASQEATSNETAHWTVKPALLNTKGLVDVKYFDATGYKGHINLGASLTVEAYAKYLSDVDGMNTVYEGYAPDGKFQYNLGDNDDILNMSVNRGVAADIEFDLEINAGAGDDLVNFFYAGTTANHNYTLDSVDWQTITGTHVLQSKDTAVHINGGAGSDKIWSWNEGSVTVKGGEGVDYVYVGQNSAVPQNPDVNHDGQQHNAVFAFNVDPTNRQIDITPNGPQAHKNGFLATDDWADLSDPGSAYTGGTVNVRVNFKGFTAEAVIEGATIDGTGKIVFDDKLAHSPNGTGGASTRAINNAIIKAIQNDIVLQGVLEAKEGSAYGLLIESLMNGLMDVSDLTIDFFAKTSAGSTVVNNTSGEYVTQFGTGATTGGTDFADLNYSAGKTEGFETFKLNLTEALGKVSLNERFSLEVDTDGDGAVDQTFSVLVNDAKMLTDHKLLLQGLKDGTQSLFLNDDKDNGGLYSIESIASDVVTVKAAENTSDYPDIHFQYAVTRDTANLLKPTVGGYTAGTAAIKEKMTITFTAADLQSLAVGDIVEITFADAGVGGAVGTYYATVTQAMKTGTADALKALFNALSKEVNGKGKLIDTTDPGANVYTIADATGTTITLEANAAAATTATVPSVTIDYGTYEINDLALPGTFTPVYQDVDVTDYVAGGVPAKEKLAVSLDMTGVKVGDTVSIETGGKIYSATISSAMLAGTADAMTALVNSLISKDGTALTSLMQSSDYTLTADYNELTYKGSVVLEAKTAADTANPAPVADISYDYTAGVAEAVQTFNITVPTAALNALDEGETLSLKVTTADGTATTYSVKITAAMMSDYDAILGGLKDDKDNLLFGEDGLFTFAYDGTTISAQANDVATNMTDLAYTFTGTFGSFAASQTGGHIAGSPQIVSLKFSASEIGKLVEGDEVALNWGGTMYYATVPGAFAGTVTDLENLIGNMATRGGASLRDLGEDGFALTNTSVDGVFTIILTANNSLLIHPAPTITTPGYSNTGPGYGGFDANGTPLWLDADPTVTAEPKEAVHESFTLEFDNLSLMKAGETLTLTLGTDYTVKLTDEMLAGTPDAMLTILRALASGTGGSMFNPDGVNIAIDANDPYKATITAKKAEGTSVGSNLDKDFTNNTQHDEGKSSNTATDYDGSNAGTYSINRVELDDGVTYSATDDYDDVIVLNIGSQIDTATSTVKDYYVNDTLVISDLFGKDAVFNFESGVDKIEFANGAKGFVSNNGGVLNAAITAANIASAAGTAGTSELGAGFLRVGDTNEYVFFEVNNDNTAGLVASEIKILGTITLGADANDNNLPVITADDVYIA